MNNQSHDIIINIVNNEFKEFQQLSDSENIPYDLNKIHEIKLKEFEKEGYFFIICAQAMLH